MTLLKINQISKRYEQKIPWILQEFSLDIRQGELLALLGESGSGKTTLLRILAGFEIPEEGEIILQDQILVNDNIFVKPEKRAIGMVFQDYALFPHLTVGQNIVYGLKKKKSAQSKQRLQELLELIDLPAITNRYPHELSGGQQQRVALARALAPQPSVLLLDEPFSNLDEVLKDLIREDIRSIIKKSGITAILVTHDIKDAMTIADRIAVISQGMLDQVDTPQKLYQGPNSIYVGQVFGKINWLPGVVTQGSEGRKVATSIGAWLVPHLPADYHHQVILGIRPESFYLGNQEDFEIAGTIKNVVFLGNCQHVEVQPQPIDNSTAPLILAQVPNDAPVEINQSIWLKVLPESLNVLEEDIMEIEELQSQLKAF